MINRRGVIKKNLGPKPTCYQFLRIFFYSITMHNFLKLSLLQAYITVPNSGVICLSETYLDSSILQDNCNLPIPGYNLCREDHPLNIERSHVAI